MSFSIKLRHRSEPYLQIRTSAILTAGHGSSEVYISGWLHAMGISGLVNLCLPFSFTQNGQSCSLFGRITTGFRGCLVFFFCSRMRSIQSFRSQRYSSINKTNIPMIPSRFFVQKVLPLFFGFQTCDLIRLVNNLSCTLRITAGPKCSRSRAV